MQEGPDINDITTDDYRMTAELRGRNYGAPGSVTFRIIPGDGEPCDAERRSGQLQQQHWYFWRFSWRSGVARLEVKENGPNGRTVFDTQHGMRRHPYRPVPHYIHLGSPMGRAGVARRDDAGHHHQERLGLVAPAACVPRRIATPLQARPLEAEGELVDNTLSLLPHVLARLCLRAPPAGYTQLIPHGH